jgi:peptidoglycan-associated lipoprotein
MARPYASKWLALAVLLVSVGCATTPPPQPSSYVVLLESPDGTVGQVRLTQAKGEVVLDKPMQGANLDGSASAPYPVDEARIRRDFGTAMAARPALPVSFLLYFESGGTRLTAESQALLPKIVEAGRNRPAPEITVIGHTDRVGAETANEKLALERANFVAGLLRSSGVAAQELAVASHGEGNPLVQTPDETPEPRNRRVEISVR